MLHQMMAITNVLTLLSCVLLPLVNLSSLDVNVDCDNTTLIQPPRVAPYSNGSSLSSVNNTSQLIISDEESASGDVHSIGNNNSTIKNINIINEQDRLCITEFLSSFPDYLTYSLILVLIACGVYQMMISVLKMVVLTICGISYLIIVNTVSAYLFEYEDQILQQYE